MSVPPSDWPRHVFSVLVDPPTSEPLTLDEAKLRAGLDWPTGDPRDEMMNDFIAAARSKVEQDTGLALLTQTRDVYYDGSPLTAPLLRIAGQSWPVQSIVSVTPYPPPPEVVPLRERGPRVKPEPDPPPDFPDLVPGEAVVIQVIAGYANLASADMTTEVPQGYCDLITPYVPLLLP
jgi:hypothetical protein